MKMHELFESVERVPKGQASALYWANQLAEQNGKRSLWKHDLVEIEAALLDGSSEKFMIQNDNRIVGAIAFSTNDTSIHIEHLGSVQKGVGTLLMKRAEAFAARKKLPVTLVPNKTSLGFYEKLGYKPAGKGDLWSNEMISPKG
jgi:GNAT superfamily N-acetyltransferase